MKGTSPMVSLGRPTCPVAAFDRTGEGYAELVAEWLANPHAYFKAFGPEARDFQKRHRSERLRTMTFVAPAADLAALRPVCFSLDREAVRVDSWQALFGLVTARLVAANPATFAALQAAGELTWLGCEAGGEPISETLEAGRLNPQFDSWEEVVFRVQWLFLMCGIRLNEAIVQVDPYTDEQWTVRAEELRKKRTDEQAFLEGRRAALPQSVFSAVLGIALLIGVSYGGDEAAVKLPGEPCSAAPLPSAPFPDRLSAYVWRNWNLVPLERLASVVGAKPDDLSAVAADLGLGPAEPVLPEWRRKGYITVLRRNWHLLGYDQLTRLLDMTRGELAFSLAEDDFLWVKLGRIKPKCEPLAWTAADASGGKRAARRRIAAILAEEKLDPSAPEEPRFAFIKTLATPDQNPKTETRNPKPEAHTSPFDFRLIFSYFADYGDPLGDPEVRSYPEGLLQKLSRQGVNAVWLHTVLRTLARDPKYPEWGEGSARRIANLKTLVARAAKYGIRVYLYLNEPRGMDDSFFRANPVREAFRGAPSDDIDIYAFCPSHPEPLRWLSDSLEQVFSQVPGLGGVFTITMSENMTHCKARGTKKPCARCAKRPVGDIIAAINRATIEGMQRGNPEAEAVLYTWNWPEAEVPSILAKLPRKGCRIMTVSENGIRFVRGGTASSVYDYSISVVGPGEPALKVWGEAEAAGLSTVAKVQVANSWELSTFPYLPVDELNARHAVNLANAGVKGVMLSWSCGCYPAPNLAVYDELRVGERTPDALLDRLAAARYGAANVARVRRAWQAFADGFSEYPFNVAVIYNGPHHWGVANPLYSVRTGYHATMVGIPYDDVRGWSGPYSPAVFAGQMEKVAKGFAAGCRALEGVADARELDMFRAEQLHFESSADQTRFVLAREAGDRKTQLEIARRELARVRTYLPLVRADSRIGYESSNHYFFIPRDVIEKALTCRQAIDGLAGGGAGCGATLGL